MLGLRNWRLAFAYVGVANDASQRASDELAAQCERVNGALGLRVNRLLCSIGIFL